MLLFQFAPKLMGLYSGDEISVLPTNQPTNQQTQEKKIFLGEDRYSTKKKKEKGQNALEKSCVNKS